MRIVYVVPFLPYPPRDGASVRIWNTLRELSHRNDVALVVQEREPADANVVESLAAVSRSLTFVPRPLPCPSPAMSPRCAAFVDTLQYPPSYLRRYRSPELITAVGELLAADGGADWLLCDTHLSGQLAFAPALPRVRRALCLFDVYDLSFRRKVALTPPGPYKAKFVIDWLKARHYERRMLRCFDLLTVVSTVDQRLVKAAAPGTPTLLVPNGVDLDYFTPSPHGPGADQVVLFVGSLSYEPNAEGLRYFLKEVWPLVRLREPRARFLVAGREPPAWLQETAAAESGLEVLGMVEDLRPLYHRARAVVVPIRLGGGTKLKVVEALAMGVPIVSTPQGCAGLQVRDGRDLLVAGTADRFADHIMHLFNDDTTARRLAATGRALVEHLYGWSAIMSDFEEALRAHLASVPSPAGTPLETTS